MTFLLGVWSKSLFIFWIILKINMIKFKKFIKSTDNMINVSVSVLISMIFFKKISNKVILVLFKKQDFHIFLIETTSV
jgi:hypothetical protein